jgi:hypothetical protein
MEAVSSRQRTRIPPRKGHLFEAQLPATGSLGTCSHSLTTVCSAGHAMTIEPHAMFPPKLIHYRSRILSPLCRGCLEGRLVPRVRSTAAVCSVDEDHTGPVLRWQKPRGGRTERRVIALSHDADFRFLMFDSGMPHSGSFALCCLVGLPAKKPDVSRPPTLLQR